MRLLACTRAQTSFYSTSFTYFFMVTLVWIF